MTPPGRAHNPFSSRHTAPGRLAYRFPEGQTLDGFLAPLAENGWTGELVGPHGVGKSTLLHAIERAARERGLKTLLWRCRPGKRRLPVGWRWKLAGLDVCFVDSAERLEAPRFEALSRRCQARRIGLIVTTHVPYGLGLSCRVEAQSETFRALVNDLVRPAGERMDETEAEELLARHGGNVREALHELYLQWEDRAFSGCNRP